MSESNSGLVLGSTGCIGNNIVRACLEAGWTVRAFHRASSQTWMRDVVTLGEALGRLPLVQPLPLEHVKTIGEWRALNVEKAQRELGLTPRPFTETVRDTLAWFREHGYL